MKSERRQKLIDKLSEKIQPLVRERMETNDLFLKSTRVYIESIYVSFVGYVGTCSILKNETTKIAKEIIEEYNIDVDEEFSWYDFLMFNRFTDDDLDAIIRPIYTGLLNRAIDADISRGIDEEIERNKIEVENFENIIKRVLKDDYDILPT